jgi:hypothetical protein
MNERCLHKTTKEEQQETSEIILEMRKRSGKSDLLFEI